jgi:Tfp pilus assembly protein PilX
MQAEQEERQRRLAAEAALREGEKRLEDKFGVILEDLEKKRKANE